MTFLFQDLREHQLEVVEEYQNSFWHLTIGMKTSYMYRVIVLCVDNVCYRNSFKTKKTKRLNTFTNVLSLLTRSYNLSIPK